VTYENHSQIPRQGRLVHSLLDEAVADTPHANAVRDSAGEWSYLRLSELSHGVERMLAAEGIGPGDRVVTLLEPTREQVALFYGVSRRGAVFVPLSPATKPYQLRSVLENATGAVTSPTATRPYSPGTSPP
jgi:acyl-CoA synthetase (AMP-forming)/AMP-acid ligase II